MKKSEDAVSIPYAKEQILSKVINVVEKFIQYILVEKRYSKHTIVSYKNDLLQFEKYLSSDYEESIEKATPVMIRSWMALLVQAGIQERTVNRKLSSLRSYYKYLIQNKIRNDNPVVNIKVLKTRKRLPNFIKQQEMDNLFNEIDFSNEFSDQRDKLLLYILFFTGIRLSELINLKDNDISDKVIRVIGKRNKERDVPITPFLRKEILNYTILRSQTFEESGNDLLLTNKGQKLYEKFVYRKVKHYLSLVTTQKEISPHVLRHTFATQMLNNGADLNAIKEILGHSDLTATQVYTHNSLEKLKGIYKQAHPRSENKK